MTILPQPPTDEDPFETVKRLQRTPATFTCLGMGCRTLVLVFVAAVIAIYILRNALGQ
jgi:hypothetical protein